MSRRRINPGNMGHQGYRMAKVTAIRAGEQCIYLDLDCGHTHEWSLPRPGRGITPQQWAEECNYMLDKRQRCGAKHIKEGEE